MKIAVAFLVVWTGTAVAAVDEGPESNRVSQRYYTESQARDLAFGPGRSWRDTLIRVDSAARVELYRATGLSEPDSVVRLGYTMDSSGAPAGAYRVASEVGKYLPFEFLVAVDDRGRVKDVVVMNYGESRGGEVRRERFLQQYRGKSVNSPVRLNQDILGIAGATLSAWAVNRGVKKTLWWHDRTFHHGARP